MTSYSCPKCRVDLFTEAELVTHDPASSKGFVHKPRTQRDGTGTPCGHIFLDQGSFWGVDSCGNKSKIYCKTPSCGFLLGDFAWSGLTCTCGAWVCPAFMIAKNRVNGRNPDDYTEDGFLKNIRMAVPTMLSPAAVPRPTLAPGVTAAAEMQNPAAAFEDQPAEPPVAADTPAASDAGGGGDGTETA